MSVEKYSADSAMPPTVGLCGGNVVNLGWERYSRDVLTRLDTLKAMCANPDGAMRYIGAQGLLRLQREVNESTMAA